MLNPKIYQNKNRVAQTVLSLSSVKRKMAKNDHVHEVGKVQKNNATFIIFFFGIWEIEHIVAIPSLYFRGPCPVLLSLPIYN